MTSADLPALVRALAEAKRIRITLGKDGRDDFGGEFMEEVRVEDGCDECGAPRGWVIEADEAGVFCDFHIVKHYVAEDEGGAILIIDEGSGPAKAAKGAA